MDEELQAALRAIERRLGAIEERLDTSDNRIEARLSTIEARVSGLPLIGEAIEVLRREMRLVKAAINDMGRTNITAGEVEALHEDVDRAQSGYIELATRLATAERLIRELQERKDGTGTS